MLDIATDGGVEKFDDLHIDEIDENWKPRERWFEAGIKAFRIAMELRKEYELPFLVSFVGANVVELIFRLTQTFNSASITHLRPCISLSEVRSLGS